MLVQLEWSADGAPLEQGQQFFRLRGDLVGFALDAGRQVEGLANDFG